MCVRAPVCVFTEVLMAWGVQQVQLGACSTTPHSSTSSQSQPPVQRCTADIHVCMCPLPELACQPQATRPKHDTHNDLLCALRPRSPLNCHVIAVLLIDMPLAFSSSIQSLVADLLLARALTSPASWMAPPYSRSFSVMVVLPDKTGECGWQHKGSWQRGHREGGCDVM